MKFLRWIIYALVGLVVMPLALDMLKPSSFWYANESIWYSIQGLGPLFATFLSVAFFHVVVSVFIAPCRKRGASIFAAIWTIVFGGFMYASMFSGYVFWCVSVLGNAVGAMGGLYFAYRYTKKKGLNQPPVPPPETTVPSL